MSEPLSDDEFNALHALLQEAALAAYPNPERNGCPGTVTLREVSITRWPGRHPAYEHIAHCSPCLSEMLELRKQEPIRQQPLVPERRLRTHSNVGQGVRWVYAAAAVFAVAIALFSWERSHGEHPGFQAAIINFAVALDRGPDGPNETTSGSEVQIYPSAVVMMTVNLPRGSDDGLYDFEIVDPRNEKSIIQAQGQAHIGNGLTTFQAKVNLSSLSQGFYSARVRRPPLGSWRAVPIRIQ